MIQNVSSFVRNKCYIFFVQRTVVQATAGRNALIKKCKFSIEWHPCLFHDYHTFFLSAHIVPARSCFCEGM